MMIVAVIHIPDSDYNFKPPKEEDLAERLGKATVEAIAFTNPFDPVHELKPETIAVIKPPRTSTRKPVCPTHGERPVGQGRDFCDVVDDKGRCGRFLLFQNQ